MRLTLLIPELLWSEPGDSDAWSAADASQLAKFLGTRRPAIRPPRAFEHALLDLAGLSADASLAAIRAAGEPAPPPLANDDAHWLCADPVHLRFHQDRLILADAAELALADAELAAVAAALNEHLAPHRFHFSSATRAYVRLAEPAAGGQRPLSQKIGCEVRPADLGDDAGLRRLANEIQILLHTHPASQAREAAGRPAMNALWLWGSGVPAKRPTDRRPDRWWSHGEPQCVVDGVARLLQAELTHLTGPLPRPGTDGIVVAAGLMRAAQYQDGAAWAEAWQVLDRDLLAPAWSLLIGGAIDELSIIAPTSFGELAWSLTAWPARLHRLSPWRRSPRTSLSALAADLARAPGDSPA